MAPCCPIQPPAEDKPKIAFHAAMMAIQVRSEFLHCQRQQLHMENLSAPQPATLEWLGAGDVLSC